MSSLYPVREASEEDLLFSTDDADVLDLLRDTSGAAHCQPPASCPIVYPANPVCVTVLVSKLAMQLHVLLPTSVILPAGLTGGQHANAHFHSVSKEETSQVLQLTFCTNCFSSSCSSASKCKVMRAPPIAEYPCLQTQAYSEKASILPTGSLMDGALTPVNSPAVTLSRRHHSAASAAPSSASLQAMLQSQQPSDRWQNSSQQSAAAQPKASKNSMQEMDSLLAAEKVGFSLLGMPYMEAQDLFKSCLHNFAVLVIV